MSKVTEQALEEGNGVDGSPMSSPPQQRSSSSSSSSSSSFRLIVALVIGVAVIGLSVGLGVGLTRNKDNNDDPVIGSNTQNSGVISGDGNNGGGVLNTTTTNISEKIRISDSTTRSLNLLTSDSLSKTYASCDDLKVDARKLLLRMANQTIMANLESWYFTSNDTLYPPMIYDTVAAPGSPEADMSTSNSAVAGSGGKQADSVATDEDNFGTNNQVDGVEEADVVLSDGDNIYTAYGSEIVKVSVASQSIVARTTIPNKKNADCSSNRISSMLLIDDRLVVFSSASSWCDEDLNKRRLNKNNNNRRTLSSIARFYGNSEDFYTIYNTGTLGIIGASQTIPGSYTSARAIGNDVYVVSMKTLNSYEYTGKLDPYTLTTEDMYKNNTKLTKEAYEAAAWKVAEDNVDEFATTLAAGLDCKNLQQITIAQNTDLIHPYAPMADSIATVTSFNVLTPTTASVSSRVMPTSYWQTYASNDTLILTTEGYWVSEEVASETFILAYKLANAKATPIGVGKIPGSLLNQFSIDEHNGFLRFATTIRERFRINQKTWESISIADSDNLIVVLKVPTSGTELEEVGRLAGLGKEGEQIYSVRFLGDRAFVVTYEVIDPFYTIDMKDPTKPTKAGELEIPGFSSYLHPIGDNLILGVGQAVVNDQASGLQISLFDVSDFTKPTRVANYVESGGDGSSSAATYDHKAFRLLENGLLILPVEIYDWSRFVGPTLVGGDAVSTSATTTEDPGDSFDGFKVYYINQEANTITDYYEISHGSNYYDGCWGYSYLSPRSMVFGGDVWTLKTHTILIHDLTDRKAVGTAGGINLDKDLDKDKCTPYYWYRGGPLID